MRQQPKEKIRFYDQVTDKRETIMGLSGLQRLQETINPLNQSIQLSFIKRNNTYTSYITPVRIRASNSGNFNNCDSAEFKKFKGELSSRSKKRIEDIIDNWHTSLSLKKRYYRENERNSTRKLVFITLTLISQQKTTDQEIKRNCLNTFLQWLRDKESKPLYLWKAEAQKNGNIHFHICIDSYIDKDILRKKWNQIQWDSGEAMDYGTYKEVINCPSTRIEAPRNVRNIRAYIAKYLSKENEYRSIEGRIWGVSRQLAALEKVPVQISKVETLKLFGNIIGETKSICKGQYFWAITTENRKQESNIEKTLAIRKNKRLNLIWEDIENSRYKRIGELDTLKETVTVFDKTTGECVKTIIDYRHRIEDLSRGFKKTQYSLTL